MSRRILDLWPWPRTAQLFSKLQENFMGNKTVANTPLRKKKGLIKGLLKDHGANENIHFIRPYFLRDLALEGGGLLRFLWKHQPKSALMCWGWWRMRYIYPTLCENQKNVGTCLWEFNRIHVFSFAPIEIETKFRGYDILWYLVHRYIQLFFHWILAPGLIFFLHSHCNIVLNC